jgi:hypothetical protein
MSNDLSDLPNSSNDDCENAARLVLDAYPANLLTTDSGSYNGDQQVNSTNRHLRTPQLAPTHQSSRIGSIEARRFGSSHD